MYNSISHNILDFIYILSSLSFIFGIKLLSKPATAKQGNLIAAAGMTLAILGTIFLNESVKISNYPWIFGALVLGSIVGTGMAKKGHDDQDAPNGILFQWNGWCLCIDHFYS